MLRRMIEIERAAYLQAHRSVNSVLHLPLVERLTHVRTRRVIVSFGIGTGIMFVGCYLAKHAEDLPFNHVFTDMVGYSLHGTGLIPFLRYAEPVWALVMAVEDEAC